MNYIIVTNNPSVAGELEDKADIKYSNVSFLELLLLVRDMVHMGHSLMSHPLSGSVKPMETPYKSIVISKKKNGFDMESLNLIESAIESCRKFKAKFPDMPDDMLKDYQLVDLALIKSALDI